MSAALGNAFRSLDGLSLGDAFGGLFFRHVSPAAPRDSLPPGPWRWTDDTHMALSIVEVLKVHGTVDQDALAAMFAQRFKEQPHRGYAVGAMNLLADLAYGDDWRVRSPELFNGGSYGNGSAMRVAPLGAYFADDLERASLEASRSAVITHAHPEGVAGAIAIAVGAALATRLPRLDATSFLRETSRHVPEGLTADGIRRALDLPADDLGTAVEVLGNGEQCSAQDTVPLCLWSAAHHLDDIEEALWHTVRALGDRDTTCAIVGGIVALSTDRMPDHLLARREPLPTL